MYRHARADGVSSCQECYRMVVLAVYHRYLVVVSGVWRYCYGCVGSQRSKRLGVLSYRFIIALVCLH